MNPQLSTAAPPVIQVRNIHRNFGKLQAVRGITFDVLKGEIFGVLGANGAGKSTLLRMLCGLLDPSAGSATVAGFDVAKQPERVKQQIGYMTQRFSLYEDLTVQENLQFYASIYGVARARRRARVEQLLTESSLTERRSQITATLSGGWKQRVALACATVHNPAILFLDEPTGGVDPVSRREFWERIHAIAMEGTTVIVTTHYMDEAERCHRLAFIFNGTLLRLGTPSAVKEETGVAVVEIELADSDLLPASERLRTLDGVIECAHFGHVLRVTTQNVTEPLTLLRSALSPDIRVRSVRSAPATVEDAFVTMVRETSQDSLAARARSEEAP